MTLRKARLCSLSKDDVISLFVAEVIQENVAEKKGEGENKCRTESSSYINNEFLIYLL